MKNIKHLFLIILLSVLTCFPTVFAAEETQSTAIAGRASYVFHSYVSYINPTYYAGDCAMLGKATGSIQITLQRQDSVNGWWFTYDRQNYTKNFSNTSVASYSRNYTLPAGNTFRCKTVVSASLNGHEDTKTVISPELTIY